jgi:hypothetical protein
MNAAPELSTGAAIAMSLFAASLWGSWFVSLKYLHGYPLDGFLMTTLTFSVLFVWSVGLVVDRGALVGNLVDIWRVDSSRVWVTLLCGIGYVIGLRLSLVVMDLLGLSLAQPIQSSVNVFGGTAISMVVGGVPEGVSPARIIMATGVLFAAVLMGLVAGRLRMQSANGISNQRGILQSPRDLWRGLGLAVVSSMFIPAYTLGLSYGLTSTTQPNGLAVLPFMAMLATGAFIGALLTCGVNLTRRNQWSMVWAARWNIHRWSVMSGTFHYGGNIIHTFGTAQISAAIAWPLGMTAGLWAQFWGLMHGEMRGAPVRAYLALFAAVALYVLGAYLIASTLYF